MTANTIVCRRSWLTSSAAWPLSLRPAVTSLAAKTATATVPIVFGVGEDPVKLGLVASLARPGGNATGINFFGHEVATKRLGLLHELVPKAVRIAVLVNPANAPAAEAVLRAIPDAARATGLQTQFLKASTSEEVEAAFATLLRDPADALFVAGDGFFVGRRVQFVTLTGPSCDTRDLFPSRVCRSRRPDELWDR